jgi:hypothetical protein
MRFTPDIGGVVSITGSGAEFRAVLDYLEPAVRAVIADQAIRVADDEVVSLMVFADAAAELVQARAEIGGDVEGAEP